MNEMRFKSFNKMQNYKNVNSKVFLYFSQKTLVRAAKHNNFVQRKVFYFEV